jgi:hypothetical protein
MRLSRRQALLGFAASTLVVPNVSAAGPRIRVFAIRGLTGSLFSHGMVILTDELNQYRGIHCTVEDHGFAYCENAPVIAENAVNAAKLGQKIVLIGHSYGGDCAVRAATVLNEMEPRIRVALLIAVDASWFSCPPVPANVSSAISYYQEIDTIGRHILQPGPGFSGRMSKEIFTEAHVVIDKVPPVHEKIIAAVREVAGRPGKIERPPDVMPSPGSLDIY